MPPPWGLPSSWWGLPSCPCVMARASWGPDGDEAEPMPREAVGTCSQLQDRLTQLHLHPALRNVTVYAEPVQGHPPPTMEVNALPVSLLHSVGSRWVCRGVEGLLGWFMDKWELHGENSPFQDTPFPLPPSPPPCQPLHCIKPLLQGALPHPGWFSPCHGHPQAHPSPRGLPGMPAHRWSSPGAALPGPGLAAGQP